ncbi:MAG: OmpA family protein [Planctomycetota bacterium]
MSRFAAVTKIVLVAGVLFLAAGCDEREKVAIAAKDDTIRQQQERIAKEQADKDQLAQANAQLGDQNRQLAENNAKIAIQTDQKVAALTQKLDGMEQLMKDLKVSQRPADGLAPDQVIGAHDRNGAIVLTVAGSALFDSGKADLKSSAHSMLLNVCKTVKARFPGNCIRVEGHTDSTPVVHNKAKYPDNMALSVARARAVYDFMIKDGGIAASKMYMAGYGEFQPLVHPEKSAEARAKNRRVEIVIMPNTVSVQKEHLAAAKVAPASSTAPRK